jgi:hypothetical protein
MHLPPSYTLSACGSRKVFAGKCLRNRRLTNRLALDPPRKAPSGTRGHPRLVVCRECPWPCRTWFGESPRGCRRVMQVRSRAPKGSPPCVLAFCLLTFADARNRASRISSFGRCGPRQQSRGPIIAQRPVDTRPHAGRSRPRYAGKRKAPDVDHRALSARMHESAVRQEKWG